MLLEDSGSGSDDHSGGDDHHHGKPPGIFLVKHFLSLPGLRLFYLLSTAE
jgi:hypothetical protein